MPFVGIRLEGSCGGLPKLEGGGVLLKPLGAGGGLKLGAGGGLNPLGVCDSLDGAELGAGLVAVFEGAGIEGAAVDDGAAGSPLGPGVLPAGAGWPSTGGPALLGATGAGVLVAAGACMEVDVEAAAGGFDDVLVLLGPVGGDD